MTFDRSINRIRIYPAFVNCTTIDWFSKWPADALPEVTDMYLSGISLGSEEEVMVGAKFLFGVKGGKSSCHSLMTPKLSPAKMSLSGVRGKSKVFVKVSAAQ